MTRTGHATWRILSRFCNITKFVRQRTKSENIKSNMRELTLYMSNQNVILTGYKTLIPERIALCRTTPLSLFNRDAKYNVGPLPTD